MTGPLRPRAGPIGMGLALLAVVGVAAWQVGRIPEAPVFAAVGPAVMPRILVAALAVLSVLYLAMSLQGRSSDVLLDEHESPLPGQHRRVAWLVGGLAALLGLTPVVGIGLAGVLAFVGIARAFDSARWGRDLCVGGCVSLAVWILFDRLLGVSLGRFANFLPWP
ncbi:MULTISPECIES: tripartite tricarboxylate transporter TctB family protein [Caldimonas]|jgi:putative tricarboxylic transport membrane protein|uniref:tripartite tricarboxylate transporter TctB family protein n=1 Tax=Caldimonas TaxID=196013 RepID=UPI00036650C5|nr:tripartite tricarboxylate transporter TctB family protein [Caldimonas manganoxidans]MCX7659989.1 tripartite tricarboxylate transporter TctB family protein [Caldimonas manganoxidans]GIX23827.1 MAG: hypothetical protein KatS3mg122_1058 [Caldimonas sp.]